MPSESLLVPLVRVQQVSKVYQGPTGPHYALTNVSLDIYRGQVLALLGENGAGKSTLSSIIATLHPATSGDVLYDNVSVYQDVSAYRAKIGICPQHPTLHDDLTLERNLIYAGRFYGMSKTEATERAQQLMSTLGLMRYAAFKPSAVSGGYKQRFMIARALMHRPELLILDEPTVGLDPIARKKLWEYIKIIRTGGTSIVLTTHYLDEAELLADRICMLERGTIKMVGTLNELRARFGEQTLEQMYIASYQETEE